MNENRLTDYLHHMEHPQMTETVTYTVFQS